MEGRFLFLGTGGSLGVPVIGCTCKVCTSTNPHNKRTRSAGLIKVGKKQFLLDVGPDFREQALKRHVVHLDGMLITHSHFDHIAGLDDVRAIYYLQHHPIPCLVSQETLDELKIRYHYLLPSKFFNFHTLPDDFGKIDFEGIPFQYFTFQQAGMKVTGFRIGDFAYVSDIREYTEQIFESLKGVKTLVLSALRHTPTAMHFSLDEAIDFAKKVGAEITYFTHIAHDLDHELTNSILPGEFRMSYDGLEIPFEIT